MAPDILCCVPDLRPDLTGHPVALFVFSNLREQKGGLTRAWLRRLSVFHEAGWDTHIATIHPQPEIDETLDAWRERGWLPATTSVHHYQRRDKRFRPSWSRRDRRVLHARRPGRRLAGLAGGQAPGGRGVRRLTGDLRARGHDAQPVRGADHDRPPGPPHAGCLAGGDPGGSRQDPTGPPDPVPIRGPRRPATPVRPTPAVRGSGRRCRLADPPPGLRSAGGRARARGPRDPEHDRPGAARPGPGRAIRCAWSSSAGWTR